MPESGKYEKLPRPESIKTLIDYLSTKPVVSHVEHVSGQELVVQRKEKTDLRIFMTNIYIVGISDIHDILAVSPSVNAIVAMSAWNGYTNEEKAYCAQQKIGLFMFNELLGAIYYDREKFVNYAPPEKSEKNKK